MNATEWNKCPTPHRMFKYLGRKAEVRKLRLFGIACCRRIWHFMTNPLCRDAVNLMERFVEEEATVAAVGRARSKLKAAFLKACKKKKESRTDEAKRWCLAAATNLLQDESDYVQNSIIWEGDSDLLSTWELAKRIYREKAFFEMPILGRELRQAGCKNRRVLSHCDSELTHVRGCWVVDSILGLQ